MSQYNDYKESIRIEVQEQIEIYKNGTKKQQKIVHKIEEMSNNIRCFHCLDTKQAWYYRGETYKKDGKGDYYRMTCAICPDKNVRDKWIHDSVTNEMYGVSGIKLFNKENYSGAERFKELEKYVCRIYPEVNEEDPVYKKLNSSNISLNKKTFYLKFEVGNIVNQCQKIFRSYCGDVMSLSSLLNNISINISNCENTNSEEQVLCEEIEDKKFIYVKIRNHSITKKKTFLWLYEYNRYKLDIDIHVSLLQPVNDSAYNQCLDIVSKLGVNEINEVKKIFLSIE